MSYLSEHIIPTEHGQTFESNITTDEKFEILKNTLINVKGVISVECEEDTDSSLKDVTIKTDGPVEIEDLQNEAKKIEVHLIRKSAFFPINL